ncbi:MAG: serine hydrolase, partial [Planctomycetota bacterium]
RTDTKFNIGSMNKMFTGVAICQLAEQGRLSFDDPIIKHLPDYPNREVAESVTIHHLLTHTSGMGSYWNDQWQARFTQLRTVEDLLPLFVDDPIAFEPGARFQYSNAGPIVLGLIIERITGQSYYDYVREAICKPAGMVDTDCYEMDVPVPNLAMGYTNRRIDGARESGPRRNNLFMHSVKGGPAGGGYSTVEDLVRFGEALRQHRLLGPEYADLLVSGKVGMGGGAQYAYLFGDHVENGHRSYGHNGGAPGISAELRVYPELGYSYAVLSNYDGGAGSVTPFLQDLISRRPGGTHEAAPGSEPAPFRLGVGLDMDPQGITIAFVAPGGPAEKAGLQPDDVVVTVNGDPFDREPLARLDALLQGPTPIVFRVRRETEGGATRELDVSVRPERR